MKVERETWREEAGLGVCSDPRREFGRDHRIIALLDEVERLEGERRDLVSRLGFGDGVTEPMAYNDTIVQWFDQQGTELRDLQDYRYACPPECPENTTERDYGEHCAEHNIWRRAEKAEAERAGVEALTEQYHEEWMLAEAEANRWRGEAMYRGQQIEHLEQGIEALRDDCIDPDDGEPWDSAYAWKFIKGALALLSDSP